MVKFNSLTIRTFEEFLLAALLSCVCFGDCSPRVPFLPMHSRCRRCGIFPLIFWDRCGILPEQNLPPPRLLVILKVPLKSWYKREAPKALKPRNSTSF